MSLQKILDKKIKGFRLLDLLVVAIAVVMGVWIRWIFADLKFPDYTMCLKPWVDSFRENGGIAGLKYEIGNYTPAYMHILMVISYFEMEPVYLIKAVGVVMDLFLAIAAAALIGHGRKRYHKIAIMLAVLLLPTVIVNSGVWGQCDNFYTFFILCALCAVVYEWKIPVRIGKWKGMLQTDDLFMLFVGLAFSFKLQTIFLAPVYAILILLKDYRLRTILWIPFVYLVSVTPSFLMGRPLRNLLTIYARQTEDYDSLQLDFPNLYSFWQADFLDGQFSGACILFCGLALVLFVYYLYNKKAVLDTGMLCSLGAFSVFFITFLLPHMHDRYAYVGEILSLYYPVENRKKIWIPILANLIALESYSETLLWFSFEGFNVIGALLRIVLIIAAGMDVMEKAGR